MPFGLTSAPAVFQALINDVLHNMLNKFVYLYLNDILIFSRDSLEHSKHVSASPPGLLKNKLYVEAEKCEFGVLAVSFLGYILAEGQLRPDPVKTEAVAGWQTPTSQKQLQQSLGFASFYRRFIRDYSNVAGLLTKLTSTAKLFVCTPEAESTFLRLKRLFISSPILTLNSNSLWRWTRLTQGWGPSVREKSQGSHVSPLCFLPLEIFPGGAEL